MRLGAVLLLVFIQPSYLTDSVNIYRTIPFTIWSWFMWKGRQTDRQNGIITDGNHRYWWNVCGLTSGSSFIEENDKAIGSTSSFICTASPTIFIVMTSLLSSEDCTLVSLHEPCSTLSATVQLCKTNVYLSVMCAIWRTSWKKNHAGRSHFMLWLCSWKISPISNSKFSFKTECFWGYGIKNSILQWESVSLLDIWACSVHISCIHSIYTFIFNTFIYV